MFQMKNVIFFFFFFKNEKYEKGRIKIKKTESINTVDNISQSKVKAYFFSRCHFISMHKIIYTCIKMILYRNYILIGANVDP